MGAVVFPINKQHVDLLQLDLIVNLHVRVFSTMIWRIKRLFFFMHACYSFMIGTVKL